MFIRQTTLNQIAAANYIFLAHALGVELLRNLRIDSLENFNKLNPQSKALF